MDSNKYGFVFFEDGTFIERRSVGWCGTPPLVYSNSIYKWKPAGENLINVKWGEPDYLHIEIISINKKELKAKITTFVPYAS